MKVSELIEELRKLPQNSRVFHLWDGKPRTEINFVWLSKKGHVVTADFEMACYSDEAVPVETAISGELKYYTTPKQDTANTSYEELYPWDV